jgi:hypothetical protein
VTPRTVRHAFLADLVAGLLAAIAAGWLAGGGAAASVGLGFAITVAFFGGSAVAVAAAERAAVGLMLPVAITVYAIMLAALGVAAAAIPDDGLLDRTIVGFTILAAATIWLVVQAVATVRSDPAGRRRIPPVSRRNPED